MQPVQQQREPWFGALRLWCLVWFSLARCLMSWLCHCTNPPHCHRSCNNCSQSRTWAGQKPLSPGSALLFSHSCGSGPVCAPIAASVFVCTWRAVAGHSIMNTSVIASNCVDLSSCVRLPYNQQRCRCTLPGSRFQHVLKLKPQFTASSDYVPTALYSKSKSFKVNSVIAVVILTDLQCFQGWDVCSCPPSSLLFTYFRLIAVFIFVGVVYESPVSR